jgi:hypothetical protein
VTAAKLADGAVTTAKIADGNVTTAKIADLNVTTGKLADSAVTTNKIADSNVTTGKIADASITAAKLNGAQSGAAPIYAARAWVNFNGTGTVAIRASGNVSSITDNGTGDYTVNFTTAMPDANYSFAINANRSAREIGLITGAAAAPSTSSLRFNAREYSSSESDSLDTCVAIFR